MNRYVLFRGKATSMVRSSDARVSPVQGRMEYECPSKESDKLAVLTSLHGHISSLEFKIQLKCRAL